VLGHLGALRHQPVVQFLDERTSMLLACCEPVLDRQSVYVAFDIEESVDAGHGLECDRRYLMSGFALAHVAGDVGQLEELAPRMRLIW